MQDEIIQIISKFLKADPSTVNDESIIDKTKVGGSIMMHRMYANLAEAGYKVNDFLNIKTLGQLRAKVSGNGNYDNATPSISGTILPLGGSTVGVDIELIDNFPIPVDYRSDGFYTDNFSPYEISYCLLKENPRASFAGLFAAKEAVVKLDNKLKGIPFSQIEIAHNEAGKPIYNKIDLSISHAGEYAIAVAVFPTTPSPQPTENGVDGMNSLMTVNELANENALLKQKTKLNSIVLVVVIFFIIVLVAFLLIR